MNTEEHRMTSASSWTRQRAERSRAKKKANINLQNEKMIFERLIFDIQKEPAMAAQGAPAMQVNK